MTWIAVTWIAVTWIAVTWIAVTWIAVTYINNYTALMPCHCRNFNNVYIEADLVVLNILYYYYFIPVMNFKHV